MDKQYLNPSVDEVVLPLYLAIYQYIRWVHTLPLGYTRVRVKLDKRYLNPCRWSRRRPSCGTRIAGGANKRRKEIHTLIWANDRPTWFELGEYRSRKVGPTSGCDIHTFGLIMGREEERSQDAAACASSLSLGCAELFLSLSLFFLRRVCAVLSVILKSHSQIQTPKSWSCKESS